MCCWGVNFRLKNVTPKNLIWFIPVFERTFKLIKPLQHFHILHDLLDDSTKSSELSAILDYRAYTIYATSDLESQYRES